MGSLISFIFSCAGDDEEEDEEIEWESEDGGTVARRGRAGTVRAKAADILPPMGEERGGPSGAPRKGEGCHCVSLSLCCCVTVSLCHCITGSLGPCVDVSLCQLCHCVAGSLCIPEGS